MIIMNKINANHYKNKKGLVRLFFAIKNSLNGIRSAFSKEKAFRQETFLAFVLILYAIFLPVGIIKTVLMIFSVLMILILELINSGIESVVDRISLSHNELSKLAKDYGSAAVMISIIACIGIYIIFTFEYFQKNIQQLFYLVINFYD